MPYIEIEKLRKANKDIAVSFLIEREKSIKRHWLLLIYMVLLMAGFNFMVRL